MSRDLLLLARRIGANLAARRQELGWSLPMAAGRIHYSYSQLRQIERGLYLPSVKFLHRASKALGIDIGRLFE